MKVLKSLFLSVFLIAAFVLLTTGCETKMTELNPGSGGGGSTDALCIDASLLPKLENLNYRLVEDLGVAVKPAAVKVQGSAFQKMSVSDEFAAYNLGEKITVKAPGYLGLQVFDSANQMLCQQAIDLPVKATINTLSYGADIRDVLGLAAYDAAYSSSSIFHKPWLGDIQGVSVVSLKSGIDNEVTGILQIPSDIYRDKPELIRDQVTGAVFSSGVASSAFMPVFHEALKANYMAVLYMDAKTKDKVEAIAQVNNGLIGPFSKLNISADLEKIIGGFDYRFKPLKVASLIKLEDELANDRGVAAVNYSAEDGLSLDLIHYEGEESPAPPESWQLPEYIPTPSPETAYLKTKDNNIYSVGKGIGQVARSLIDFKNGIASRYLKDITAYIELAGKPVFLIGSNILGDGTVVILDLRTGFPVRDGSGSTSFDDFLLYNVMPTGAKDENLGFLINNVKTGTMQVIDVNKLSRANVYDLGKVPLFYQAVDLTGNNMGFFGRITMTGAAGSAEVEGAFIIDFYTGAITPITIDGTKIITPATHQSAMQPALIPLGPKKDILGIMTYIDKTSNYLYTVNVGGEVQEDQAQCAWSKVSLENLEGMIEALGINGVVSVNAENRSGASVFDQAFCAVYNMFAGDHERLIAGPQNASYEEVMMLQTGVDAAQQLKVISWKALK